MSADRVVRVGTLLFLAFLCWYFYLNSHSPVIGRQNAVVNTLLRFKQVDASLNQQVLMAHFDLLHNYDPLVAGVRALNGVRADLVAELTPLADRYPDIGERLAGVGKGLDEKERLLEGYKSENAVLKNSQRYFPTAAAELATLLKRRGDSDGAVDTALFALMADAMGDGFGSGAEYRRRVDERIDRMREVSKTARGDVRAGIDTLLRHASLMAAGMERSRSSLDTILALPLTDAVDNLFAAYERVRDVEARQTQKNRLGLFVTAVVMVGYVGFMTFRLTLTLKNLGRQKFALDQHAIVTSADIDWKITYANDSMAAVSRYRPADLIGQDQRTFDGGGRADELFAAIEATVARGEVWKGEYQNRDKEGRGYWVEATVVPFLSDNGLPNQYMTIRTDISGRKEAERDRGRLSMAIEQAADSIIITDADGNIQYANPAFEIVTGFTREEVVGRNPRILKSGKHGEAFYENMWRTLTEGKVWSGRIVNRRKDGGLYEEESAITPVVDDEGRIVNYVAVKNDVTRRERLNQARQFFSSIASHELRTPLTKLQLVKMLIERLQEESPGSDTAAQAARVLTESYDDLDRVVSSTTLLAELQLDIEKLVKSHADVRALLRSSVDITRTQLRGKNRSLDLILALDKTPVDARIVCDPNLILRALDEILSNAVKYSPDGAPIRLEGEVAGNRLVVRVIDRGAGIAREELGAVAEPFFSPDNPNRYQTGRYGYLGGGMGLGLSLVTLIVEAHGGRLIIASDGKGKGATVEMDLPLTPPSSVA